MPEEEYYETFDKGSPSDKDQGGRLGVVIAILVTIVVSIILFNGIFPGQTGDNGNGNDIPDYIASDDVEYVNDGDTFKTTEGDYIRLLNINTEETGQPHSTAAKQRLEELLTSGGEIELVRDIEDTDRYGRLLRHVFINYLNGTRVHVNLELVREGYAHVYVIEPNVRYWDEMKAAEQEAIDNQRVLWQPSAFDIEITELEPVQGSGSAGLNIERVTFRNNGSVSIDMTGWTVKDESTHIYEFDTFSLAPNMAVSLRSGLGDDTLIDVYWDLSSSIWNNAGDVCFLRDENGLLVDAWRYWSEGGQYVWLKYEV